MKLELYFSFRIQLQRNFFHGRMIYTIGNKNSIKEKSINLNIWLLVFLPYRVDGLAR